MTAQPTVIPLPHAAPRIDPEAWVAPTAVVIGDAELAPGSSVFYGAVVRADNNSVALGARSNLQDNVVVHTDPAAPTVIGEDVSVGHGAVVHGCEVQDGSLIGMNATVLSHAVIGTGSLVAAGAVVMGGTVVPPNSLVAGVPAKVRRELTEQERESLRDNAARYVDYAAMHREAVADL